jgi:hypothetical protein
MVEYTDIGLPVSLGGDTWVAGLADNAASATLLSPLRVGAAAPIASSSEVSMRTATESLVRRSPTSASIGALPWRPRHPLFSSWR